MNIAVCDDNLEFVNTLENHFDMLHDKKLNYDVFLKGEDLINEYENNKTNYDAIFLDMELNGLNGIETAKEIRKINSKVIIVFITAYSEYMKESFECEPFRFLLKPISFNDIKKVYSEILNKFKVNKNTFSFYEGRKHIRLYYEDIIFFESQSHWVNINTDKSKYRTLDKINEIHKKLDDSLFCRIHQSYIVNFKYIKLFDDNKIFLYNSDEILSISRPYKKEFLESYMKFKEGEIML